MKNTNIIKNYWIIVLGIIIGIVLQTLLKII